MIDYLKKYGTKPTNTQSNTRKFEGGGMTAPAPGGGQPPMPQPGGGADPMAGGQQAPGGELEAMVQEFVTTQDPQLAVQICQMLASQMGLDAPAPQVAPGAPGMEGGGQPPMAQPAPQGGGGMPMGRSGMAVPKPRQFNGRVAFKPSK